jgi:RHS repeat-associated protein
LFGYAGYQYDSETGLYYLNARYYDSKIARFLSEDTYAGDAGDPLSLNLYTYCSNNPIMYIDPTGHWAVGDNDRSAAAQAQILEATRLYNEAKQNKQSTTAAEKMANDARSGKIYYANAVSASDIDKTYNEVLGSKYVSQSAKSDLKSSDMNTISTAVYVAGARPVAQAELKSINQERKNSNEFNPNETSLNVGSAEQTPIFSPSKPIKLAWSAL